jgi:hypothetical protein
MSMSFSAAMSQIWDALADVMVVNPLWAAAWLVVVIALAVLLAFGWQRLFNS